MASLTKSALYFYFCHRVFVKTIYGGVIVNWLAFATHYKLRKLNFVVGKLAIGAPYLKINIGSTFIYVQLKYSYCHPECSIFNADRLIVMYTFVVVCTNSVSVYCGSRAARHFYQPIFRIASEIIWSKEIKLMLPHLWDLNLTVSSSAFVAASLPLWNYVPAFAPQYLEQNFKRFKVLLKNSFESQISYKCDFKKTLVKNERLKTHFFCTKSALRLRLP